MRHYAILPLLLAACVASLGQAAPAGAPAAPVSPLKRIEEAPCGTAADGTVVKLYTLRNAKGMSAKFMSYGAIICGINAPDRDGKFANVVAGVDTYAAAQRFGTPGATIGPVINRIAGAKFTLDGVDYKLQANDGPNTLHSGNANFGLRLWEGKALEPKEHEASVEFTIVNKDGNGGLPGNITAKITFTLNDENEVRLDYQATTDKTTLINMSNHAYFNLAGTGNVMNQELWVDADKYTAYGDRGIPTGEVVTVKGTPYDFTKPTKIGGHPELGNANGNYDHNLALNSGGKSMALAARLTDPSSGRIMEVKTDRPGLQIYTARAPHAYVTMETQAFADAIHHPNFPSTLLKPGETYKASTIFAFSAK